MSKPTIFSTLLDQQMSGPGIPDMVFTTNSQLRDSLRAIMAATPFDDNMPSTEAMDAVAAYAKLSTNKLHNGPEFDAFQQLADAFATKLAAGIEALRVVKKEVIELNDSIIDRLNGKMVQHPMLAEAFNLTGEATMPAIDWSGLNNINEQSVVAKLHDSINYSITAPITNASITLLLGKIPYATPTNQVTLTPINLKAERLDSVVSYLRSQITDKTSETIKGALLNILQLDAHTCLSAINSLRAFASGEGAATINRHIELANLYSRILPHITNERMNLSASTYAELVKHIGIIQQLTDMSIYLCTYYRSTVWKDAILVNGPLINPDNQEAYESAEGTTTKLHQIYNELFDGGRLPVMGVSIAYAVRVAGDVTARTQQRASIDRAQANAKRDTMLRDEFVYAATEWLSNNRTNFSPKFTTRDLSRFAESVYDSAPNTPLTSKLYALVLNSCHLGKMTPVLYNRLGAAYVKQASSVESLNREQCDVIEAGVYADMISEYIVEQGIILL